MRPSVPVLPLVPAAAILGLAGCGGGKPIEFPGGLEPFTDPVPECPAGEGVEVDSERPEEGFVATSCGTIAATFEAVTAAVETPEVGVDRRVIDFAECVVRTDVEPEYDVSYAVDTLVHDTVDVEYTLTWRHGSAGEGVLASRWQMTTTNAYVSVLEGSIVTTDRGDGTISVEVVEHIDALLESKEEVIVQFQDDLHASIRAAALGEPLPTW